jgi:hypothetical protein
MTDFQEKLISLAIIALATIFFVYNPWRAKKICPSCKIKVDKSMNHCPKCNTALL